MEFVQRYSGANPRTVRELRYNDQMRGKPYDVTAYIESFDTHPGEFSKAWYNHPENVYFGGRRAGQRMDPQVQSPSEQMRILQEAAQGYAPLETLTQAPPKSGTRRQTTLAHQRAPTSGGPLVLGNKFYA